MLPALNRLLQLNTVPGAALQPRTQAEEDAMLARALQMSLDDAAPSQPARRPAQVRLFCGNGPDPNVPSLTRLLTGMSAFAQVSDMCATM